MDLKIEGSYYRAKNSCCRVKNSGYRMKKKNLCRVKVSPLLYFSDPPPSQFLFSNLLTYLQFVRVCWLLIEVRWVSFDSVLKTVRQLGWVFLVGD